MDAVFDLQALILNRFFSVVPQTHQKKKQRSLRPSDVTVNLKITSELSVSPYNEIAQWLALHNNVYSFSQAVFHFRDGLIKERSYFCTYFLPSRGKESLKISDLRNGLFDLIWPPKEKNVGVAQEYNNTV